MIQYLVIQLCDSSVSYCHYENNGRTPKLMGLQDVKDGIVFGMKENLMIQFVYPEYELPQAYKDAIESIDHSKIMPFRAAETEKADVLVFDSWSDFFANNFTKKEEKSPAYVLRSNKSDLFKNGGKLVTIFSKISRLNVLINDIETFTESDFEQYEIMLDSWIDPMKTAWTNGTQTQFNLLTDRLLLDKMNNCNAGNKNITLAPNGKFYVCPAFYAEDENDSIGGLAKGIDIKNPQLYKIEYAPICRKCDAYQCKRCVWLNRKTTLEANTPSHQQCVAAHLERNASRKLLAEIRKVDRFMEGMEIPVLDYLDPFDVVK